MNVGHPREVEWNGNVITTAIWKAPVEGPIRVEGVNLAGDDQADRRVHGGPDKAVYAYASEDYGWWRGQLDELDDGAFGENLTTAGIDLRESRIGDRWQVGTATLEVSQPRSPCFKLGIRMGDGTFPIRFTEAERAGAYLRIVEPGEIEAGDAIMVTPTRPLGVRIGSLAERDVPIEVLREAATDQRVPEGWRRSATRDLERRGEAMTLDAEVSAERG